MHLARGFSWQFGSIRAAWTVVRTFPSPLGQRSNGFAYRSSLPAWRPCDPGPTTLRPPITHNGDQRYRNLNLLSITYASRPRLRPDSPAVDQHGCGTLGHSVEGIRTPLSLLMPTFALLHAPDLLPRLLHCGTGRSPTNLPCGTFRGFGARLEPRWIVGAATPSTSELLRTLSRVAASKPTSWLFTRRNYLAHLVWTWGP